MTSASFSNASRGGIGLAARVIRRRAHWLACAWLLAALCIFGDYVQRREPFASWQCLFWARAWACTGLFGASCLAVGLRLLAWLGVAVRRRLERTSLALALGVLTFVLGLFFAGCCSALNARFFLIWPLALLASGWSLLARQLRETWRGLTSAGRVALPRSVPQLLALLLLFAGAAVVYAQVITPANIGFDARWYHLPIAEGFAAQGRIRPFAEGWYLGAYPQLASWVYTWAFLAPGALAHHLCLAAHLEFFLLLATLLSVSALAARLLTPPRVRFGGAALFLFPSLFVYDSNLNCGADHVLAFWAAPIALALLRYLAAPLRRNAALLGLVLAGAALTRYQAIYFLVPAAIALVVVAVRTRRAQPALVVLGIGLVVTAPHWLKNAIAYHDPLYPNLFRWLSDRPLFHGASDRFPDQYWFSGEPETRRGLARAAAVARETVRFSFSPKGWGKNPDVSTVFGSLYTLLLPLAFFSRPRWRIFVLIACTQLALATWAYTYAYDRYLQAILPWMAACTAALLVSAWRTRRVLVRALVVALVLLQLAWGGDAYFARAHEMLAQLPLQLAGDAKAANFTRGAYPGEELAEIGARLPKRARVVGHDFYQSVGVGVQTITDNPDWQGRFNDLQLDAPEALYGAWRAVEATHILWPLTKEARGAEDLAHDAVFGRAAFAYARGELTVAGYRVAAIEARSPPRAELGPTHIAWLACGERKLALYTPAGLAAGQHEQTLERRELEKDVRAALAPANAVWLASDCADGAAARSQISQEFEQMLRTGPNELWVRR